MIYDAFYRSFIPTAGQLRELDAISSVIIGGGSIFGGYGTMIGSLAGAGVITLIRSLLSLQIILHDGSSFVLPQQWQNVFIGLILIIAVVGDIWLRQNNILGQWFGRFEAGRGAAAGGRGDERMTTPIVEMRGINKSFGPVQALVDVHLRLMPGEVLGLVGDNSAGKSTLMKILTGAYQRDAGDIFVDGEPVRFKSPHESRDRGIEMIYQDFALCGNLDVGAEHLPRALADALRHLRRSPADAPRRRRNPQPAQGRRELGLPEGREPVGRAAAIGGDRPRDLLRAQGGDFRRADRQSLGDRDPSPARDDAGTEAHGVAQVIISHRLTDIFEVGDRVMVLKRGRNVGERAIAQTTEKEVLELIVSGVPETPAAVEAAV